jgi:hypothetical protein
MHASVLRWLSLFVLVGCGGGSVSLLELEAPSGVIELGVLERGSEVEIAGRGFPVGGAGTARLIGVLRAPGENTRRLERAVDVTAVTGERLALRADAVIDVLGGRGTFEGRLRVEFRARAANATLTAEQPVVLDLSALTVSEQHALRVHALSVLDRLGIEVSEDATTHEGVTVSVARAASHAALLGMREGDVIERAAGVRVHALGDLVPPPLASVLELHVRRIGTSAPVTVHLPLDASVETSALPLERLSWLIGWAIGLALAFGHRSSLAVRGLLAIKTAFAGELRERSEPREGVGPDGLCPAGGGTAYVPPIIKAGALGVFGGEPVAPEQRRRRVLLVMVASFFGVMLVCFEPAGFLSVRSITLYLPLVAVSVALAVMRRGKSTRQRGREGLLVLRRMTVMGAVLACACALSGTRALDGIVAPQGAWPWQWGVLQHLALLSGVPLFLVYGAQIGDAEPSASHGPAKLGRLLVLERVLTNVVLAAFGAAIFFGGWQSPLWMTLGPWPERLPGALLFVLKAWGVAFALASARERGATIRKRTTLILCGAMIVLTTLEVLLEPTRGILRFTGQTFSVALGTALGLGLAQMWLAGRSKRPALSIAFGAK